MFKEVNLKQSFPEVEVEMQKKWKEEETFKKSLEISKNKEGEFVFYDGPPFGNGLPHIGHLLQSTMKDIIGRYKTMQGYHVERRWGWDCHGLPVETEVEKQLGIKNKTEIDEMGTEKFSESCRESIVKYASQWEETITRFGRWVDFKNCYRTMDKDFMESVWWVFKTLHDKNLIYQGLKVVPYCWKTGTPLSNYEVSEGYQEVQDKAITVKFKLKDEEAHLLAWTTTPWTLLSNQALAVGPEVEYSKIKDIEANEIYIVATPLLSKLYKEEQMYDLIKTLKGKDLEGKQYTPPINFFENLRKTGSFKIHCADFVEIDSGTGIVHLAPYGEADFEILTSSEIELVTPVTPSGDFDQTVGEFAGLHIFDANEKIIQKLKDDNNLIKQETIVHQYPFNDRTKTRLIYMPINTWFLDVPKIKEKMLHNNSQINWVPDHIKDGRFGKWLENARSWGISRNRYWGTPLPVWKSTTTDKIVVIGSIDDLEKYSGERPDDIHKFVVDKISFEYEGEIYEKIPEVFDCWFESGSMPFGQMHYPFENKEKFEANFPADFIGEAIDQTRGWFYTLTVIATGVMDKPAFKNVICTGHILGEGGVKLSKRLKNYTDPNITMETVGADPLRWALVDGPVVLGESSILTDQKVKDVVKDIILPLWNTYSFFTTYANIDNWESKGLPENLTNQLDQWIISQLNECIENYNTSMESYHIVEALKPIKKLVDDLTNWYIRRSRRRFWKNDNDTDKNEGYEVLLHTLTTISKILAPIMPHISEYIYTNLTNEESVHLTSLPTPNKNLINKELSERVATIREIIATGLAVRAQAKIKVRQPISEVSFSSTKNFTPTQEETKLILEELNAKVLQKNDNPKELADITYLPNGQKLKEFGRDIGNIIAQAKQGNIIENKDGTYLVANEFTLTPDQIEKRFTAKEGLAADSGPTTLVALNTKITDELKYEGYAREIIRHVQDLRKEAGYDVDDRIILNIDTELLDNINQHLAYIEDETLSKIKDIDTPDKDESFEIDGQSITIKIKK